MIYVSLYLLPSNLKQILVLVEVVRLLKPRFDGVVDLEVIVCRFDFAGVSNNSSGISFKKRDGRFACERPNNIRELHV